MIIRWDSAMDTSRQRKKHKKSGRGRKKNKCDCIGMKQPIISIRIVMLMAI